MKKIITIIVLLIVIVGGVVAWKLYFTKQKKLPTNPVACTMEAKLCPDGSTVGRTGPNCEFATCPTPIQTNPNWLTFADTTQGISFKYPETLETKYISTQEWPPKVNISNDAFSCTTATSPNGLPATTTQKKINGEDYCVNVTSEGAAGTIYITYNYSTETNSKLINLNFILRYPECGNYPEPQMTECNTEHTNFNLDNLIDQIAQSVKIN